MGSWVVALRHTRAIRPASQRNGPPIFSRRSGEYRTIALVSNGAASYPARPLALLQCVWSRECLCDTAVGQALRMLPRFPRMLGCYGDALSPLELAGSIGYKGWASAARLVGWIRKRAHDTSLCLSACLCTSLCVSACSCRLSPLASTCQPAIGLSSSGLVIFPFVADFWLITRVSGTRGQSHSLHVDPPHPASMHQSFFLIEFLVRIASTVEHANVSQAYPWSPTDNRGSTSGLFEAYRALNGWTTLPLSPCSLTLSMVSTLQQMRD